MQTAHGLSARRADRVLQLSRSARHYRPRQRDDGPLIAAIQAHLENNPEHGVGLLMEWALRPRGWGWPRAWRVYTTLKLKLPRRGKRWLPDRVRATLEIPQAANHTWSADFMSDALWSGRRFRTFNINDDFNRESMKILVDCFLKRISSLPDHSAATAYPRLLPT
ncbi:hypothetical protein NX80_018460 [Xanthomonas vasicola pv. arecae]|uniref:hypothetical protein n=1 Tax=Xanthomonas vasicola TaxID=56459 RepID=UPI000F850A4B|nr:hypothetical protein [Xanthomonas vasicola]AZR28112.1 hypothetical protein NX80_018460 [Xanthomonas vasicola pv. arecae]